MILPDEQIASVQGALASLRNCKRFRGQDELIWDVEQQLTTLQECHEQGCLDAIVIDAAPMWPYVTLAVAVVAGVVKAIAG